MPRKPAAGRPRSCGPWRKALGCCEALNRAWRRRAYSHQTLCLHGQFGLPLQRRIRRRFWTTRAGRTHSSDVCADHGDVDLCPGCWWRPGRKSTQRREGITALVVASAMPKKTSLNSCWIRARVQNAADAQRNHRFTLGHAAGDYDPPALNPFSYMTSCTDPMCRGWWMRCGAWTLIRMCVSPKVPSTFSAYGVNPTGATPFMLAAATYDVWNHACFGGGQGRPQYFLLQRTSDASDGGRGMGEKPPPDAGC